MIVKIPKQKKRKKIKILQITNDNFPTYGAMRVLKETISLYEDGYDCIVLCPPRGNKKEQDEWQGIQIFRPNFLDQRSFVDKIFGFFLLFSPAWYKAIKMAIAKYQPDVLHIHDIWLGRVAFATKGNKKIVMDLHENMPAAVEEYRKDFKGLNFLFRYLFHSKNRILSYERNILKKSDIVLTVVQEAVERVLVDHPDLEFSKVFNVENLESKQFIAKTNLGKPTFIKDHFSVVYIGGFGPHRGLDTLIRAMLPIKKNNFNIKLHLIGAQPNRNLEILKQLLVDIGVQNLVQITGWVDSGSVLANIQQADLCCVPHHSNPHTDSTIPHKLYQYMIAKRPILVSSSVPLARTIKQAKAGMIFKAGDPEDCANKIIMLSEDKTSCDKLANNAFDYVLKKGHNWEEESALNLLKAYDQLFTPIKYGK